MSFDLYVWGSPSPVTAAQAERICRQLAAGDASSVSADGRVRGFARELLGRFPALEGLALMSSRPRPGIWRPRSRPAQVGMGPNAGNVPAGSSRWSTGRALLDAPAGPWSPASPRSLRPSRGSRQGIRRGRTPVPGVICISLSPGVGSVPASASTFLSVLTTLFISLSVLTMKSRQIGHKSGQN
jgi:hypothetical protein